MILRYVLVQLPMVPMMMTTMSSEMVSGAKSHTRSLATRHSKNVAKDTALFMTTPPYSMLKSIEILFFCFFFAIFADANSSDMLLKIGTIAVERMKELTPSNAPRVVNAAMRPSATRKITTTPTRMMLKPSLIKPYGAP